MELRQITPYKWELPKTGKMRVPGIIYAEHDMLQGKQHNEPLKQVANVAQLPGIDDILFQVMVWVVADHVAALAAGDASVSLPAASRMVTV